jgi:hypothetical protein
VEEAPAPGYELIQAKTEENAHNLPEGYIDSLRDSYPSNLLAAYLDGEFVNLTSGSVYPEFDRALNARARRSRRASRCTSAWTSTSARWRGRARAARWRAACVDELTGVLDTPAMIASIKARYVGHSIWSIPMRRGTARKSNNASESDIALLRAARFTVLVNAEQSRGEGSRAGDESDDPFRGQAALHGQRRQVPGAGGVPGEAGV